MTLAGHGFFTTSSEAWAARRVIWTTEAQGNLHF